MKSCLIPLICVLFCCGSPLWADDTYSVHVYDLSNYRQSSFHQNNVQRIVFKDLRMEVSLRTGETSFPYNKVSKILIQVPEESKPNALPPSLLPEQELQMALSAHQVLSLQSARPLRALRLYDLSAKLCRTQTLDEPVGECEMLLDDMAPGCYVLQVQGLDFVKVEKILIP